MKSLVDLIKIGYNINTSMFYETYNRPDFLEHFVKCESCGNWIKWKLSKKKESLICARCAIGLCNNPRSKKTKKEVTNEEKIQS